MLASLLKPIPHIIQQHAEEAAHLRLMRSVLVSAPNVKLHHLRRRDDRLAAHLDGLAVAGEYGSSVFKATLEAPGAGEVFAATVRAIEEKDERRLDKLFALVIAVPAAQPGLISAFGWVSSQHLQGTGARLLASPEPFKREVGIAACVMHRVDPGAALSAAIADSDAQLRARALRAGGELGRHNLLAACMDALLDENVGCRFWAAYSAVLLGNRTAAVESLTTTALQEGLHRVASLRLLLKIISLPQANELLKMLARNPDDIRLLIQGAGITGDPYYVPWLIINKRGRIHNKTDVLIPFYVILWRMSRIIREYHANHSQHR